ERGAPRGWAQRGLDRGGAGGRLPAAVVGILEFWSRLMAPSAPIATYRLQLTAAFGFREAAAIAPYLRALGISHVYASPILKARADSTHGYDMVDASAIDPKLGGENGFAELAAALRAAGLGLIADFVPNHMGVLYADNAWW